MSTSIGDIFPQLQRITDTSLRQKTIQCWEEALRRGGWQLEDVEVIPFTLLLGPDKPSVTANLLGAGERVSLAAHTRAVTDCSIALGEVLAKAYGHIYEINADILTAGALLHDVGKPLEYARTSGESYVISPSGKLLRHPIFGCALAAELGLPEAVQHIIAVHSREGDGGYRSPEAWIVHHADFVNFEPLRSR